MVIFLPLTNYNWFFGKPCWQFLRNWLQERWHVCVALVKIILPQVIGLMEPRSLQVRFPAICIMQVEWQLMCGSTMMGRWGPFIWWSSNLVNRGREEWHILGCVCTYTYSSTDPLCTLGTIAKVVLYRVMMLYSLEFRERGCRSGT